MLRQLRLRGRGPESPSEIAAFAAQPDLDAAAALCVRAWNDLSTCRPIGMDVGPIPWTAIVTWAEFHELDLDSTMLITDVIRLLDFELSEREESRRRTEEAKAKAKR